VYQNLPSNFQPFSKISNNSILLANGNFNHIVTNHIDFEMHKAPSVMHAGAFAVRAVKPVRTSPVVHYLHSNLSVAYRRPGLFRQFSSANSKVVYRLLAKECGLPHSLRRKGKAWFLLATARVFPGNGGVMDLLTPATSWSTTISEKTVCINRTCF